MAATSSRVEEDCSPPPDRDVDAGLVLGEGQSPTSSITDAYGMSDGFFATCESATATLKCNGNDHLAIVEVGQSVKDDPDYSSDGGSSGRSEGSSGDFKMSPVLVNSIKSWSVNMRVPSRTLYHAVSNS